MAWPTSSTQRGRERLHGPGSQPGSRADSAIRTEITRATEFWPAEAYHQDYYRKNPARYKFYVTGCGRYDRLEELWETRR